MGQYRSQGDVSRDQRLVALTECLNRRRAPLWITRVE